MKRSNSIVQIVAIAFFSAAIPSISNSTVGAFLSSGANCNGAAGATFVPGGPSLKISVCVSTSSEYSCGFTIRLQSANAGENDKFRIVAQTSGPDYNVSGTFTFPSPAPITNPPSGIVTNTETALGMGLVPAQNRLLATYDVAPQGTATNATYIIGLSPISMISIGSGTGVSASCYFIAPSDAGIVGNFTFTKQ